MAHVTHFKKTQVGNMMAHHDREQGSNRKYSNQEIDHSKTKMNYNLFDRKELQSFSLRKRVDELEKIYIENVKKKHRNDLNVMSCWVVTLPKQKQFENNSAKQKEFFEHTVNFLVAKYGDKNVIAANVHNDETSPHLHFSFVPVVMDKKRNFEKISSKECLSRSHLRYFHQELSDYLEDKMGFKCKIVDELKASETIEKEENPNQFKDFSKMSEVEKAEYESKKFKNRTIDELKRDSIVQNLNEIDDFFKHMLADLEENKQQLLAPAKDFKPTDYEVKRKFGGKEVVEMSTSDFYAFRDAIWASKADRDDFRIETATKTLKKASEASEAVKNQLHTVFEQNENSLKQQRLFRKQIDELKRANHIISKENRGLKAFFTQLMEKFDNKSLLDELDPEAIRELEEANLIQKTKKDRSHER